MKTKIILLFTLIFAFITISFGQTVKITGKKVTYKRTAKDVPDHRKTFEINYPVISGAFGKKMESILNYERNFEFKIAEEKTEIYWLSSADFEVKYNKSNILQVDLFIEGMGAYPSGSTKRIIINSKTGTRVKPSDVFVRLEDLAAMAKKAQQTEIKKAKEEYKKDPDSADLVDNEYFTNADFKPENLWAFTVSETGITFHYDYQFPHVIKALQPDGDYFYKWSELKPFIKKDGLFGVFVK